MLYLLYFYSLFSFIFIFLHGFFPSVARQVFTPLPHPRRFQERLYCLWANPENLYPWSMKLLLFWRILSRFFVSPLWLLLWHAEGWYLKLSPPGTRQLYQPVFILAGPRTGSTNFHRQLISANSHLFYAPSFFDLIFPFISIQHGFHKLPLWLIHSIEKFLQNLLGNDVIEALHPMSLLGAEEDDFLISDWQWCGLLTTNKFPSLKVWLKNTDILSLSSDEQQHTILFYRQYHERLAHRNPGKRLLSKSHLIDYYPLLKTVFPTASFVNICRHPAEQFPSHVNLHLSAMHAVSGVPNGSQRTWVDAMLTYLDKTYALEMRYFHNNDRSCEASDRDRHTIVFTFDRLKHDIRTVFDEFAKVARVEHLRYPSAEAVTSYQSFTRTYKNPSLHDLGLSLDILELRFRTYLQATGVKYGL